MSTETLYEVLFLSILFGLSAIMYLFATKPAPKPEKPTVTYKIDYHIHFHQEQHQNH